MAIKLPVKCPSCESPVQAIQLKCMECETAISGNFPLPDILQLSYEDQEFVLNFFLASGSLKEMASQMKVSYPTVRNHLDDLIEKIQKIKKNES